MHSGGANTTLKNNRNLLKKRPSRFKYKRSHIAASGKGGLGSFYGDKILTTLSASELKRMGRRLRRRNRAERIVVLLLILTALLFVFRGLGIV